MPKLPPSVLASLFSRLRHSGARDCRRLPLAWVDDGRVASKINGVILFYDGLCGFCDWTVQFLLRRDHAARIRFAPLQGKLAAETLGAAAAKLDTVWAQTSDGRLLMRSRAVLHAVRQLGGGWAAFAVVMSIWPTFVLDLAYRLFARYRHRLFGTLDACKVPNAADRARFID